MNEKLITERKKLLGKLGGIPEPVIENEDMLSEQQEVSEKLKFLIFILLLKTL